MKWLLGGVGLIMAIMGGVNLGAATSGGSSSFVYEEATTEEREEWLNAVATKLESRAKREAASTMYVSYKETKTLHNRREVQTIMKLGYNVDFRMGPNTIQDAKDGGCPFLIRSGLYANNGKWTQKIVKGSGQTAFNFTLSRSNCSSYARDL